MKSLFRFKKKQKGLSGFGLIIVIGLFALLIISLLKVFPMYYENYKVKAVLESLRQNSDIDPESKRDIWGALSKGLYVQRVEIVKREDVDMSRKNGKTTIDISYETRDSYFGNLFIGAAFSESVVIDR
ncbi:MAG: F0F1-type ATP synthase membrane subunit c/vacuolar-type H+-ATPase subunit K [Gammaproteobacteria bacterium]|jgi:F0F1-type ATP synthase membrane subunit c/vacuolar-type H+-ATPase subunit K